MNLDFEERTIIHREISFNGKSRAFINDIPVNLELLKKITNRLIDIHTQSETFQLINQEFQRKLVDTYASNHILLKSYQKTYEEYKKNKAEYTNLLRGYHTMQKEYELDDALLKELEEADLESTYQGSLKKELETLENIENIKSDLNSALKYLSKSDICTESNLKLVIAAMNRISKYEKSYNDLKRANRKKFDRINGYQLWNRKIRK